MNGIEQLFIQNVAAVSISGLFIFYLRSKDKFNQELYNKFSDSLANFNQTIQNHLHESTSVIKENAKALEKLSTIIKSGKIKKRR